MIFDFSSFVDDLRHDPEHQELVSDYQKHFGSMPSAVGEYRWYRDYASKFLPYYVPMIVPEDFADDFDYQLFYCLVVSSLNMEYGINVIDDPYQGAGRIELILQVQDNDNEIEKNLKDLWGFQIFRLFEILLTEQLTIQVETAKDPTLNLEELLEERMRRFKSVWEAALLTFQARHLTA